jgi:hypothetical protein
VQPRTTDFAPYLEQLRALPFVKAVSVDPPIARDDASDGIVTLQTPSGKTRYTLEVKRSPVTRTVAADLLSRRGGPRSGKTLLFSQYVAPAIADELVAHGVQYIDAVGNQYLQIGDRYFVRSSGKRPPRTTPLEHKSTQPTGYLVYFALLADVALRDAPIRTIASAVGVSKSAVSNAISKLEAQKLIVRRRNHASWVDTRALLERWLVGYTEVVRPRMFLGGYRTQDPEAIRLEKQLEAHVPARVGWAFGGGAAAYRLTGHYRGEKTVVHLTDPALDLSRALRAVRTENNPTLILLRASGPLLLQGVSPRTAHPILVYTELLSSGDERAREAAGEIREQLLRELLA